MANPIPTHTSFFGLFLLIQVLFLCTSTAVAFAPSAGLQTNDQVRQQLNDSQFKIDTLRIPPLNLPGYQAYIAGVHNTPLLAGNDVQAQIVVLRMQPGSFSRHYHPRAFEIITVLRGKIETTLQLENPQPVPRIVKLTLRYGQSTVIPLGLIHSVKCMAKAGRTCLVHEAFNSGDAGHIVVS